MSLLPFGPASISNRNPIISILALHHLTLLYSSHLGMPQSRSIRPRTAIKAYGKEHIKLAFEATDTGDRAQDRLYE